MSHLFNCPILALSLALPALAGPAMPDPIELEQPDGTRIPARILGDEFQGWTETLEGYAVVQDRATGLWEYAQREGGALVSSGQTVSPGESAPAFLSRGIRPSRDLVREQSAASLRRVGSGAALEASSPEAASSNTRKLLVILVNFADRALMTTPSTWSSVIFQTGSGVKSVRQFYLDNSFNAVDIQPVSHTQSGSPSGVVSVTLATNHPNYGATYVYATEVAWLNLALAQAAAYVDFAALDTSGDGVITPAEAAIYFIPAGYDTSGTSKTPSIWAHAWGGALSAGTKSISKWAMNGELNDASHQHPMGVMAHELGHSLMDLPDLYDTSGTNKGLGYWSLMSYGSWGRDTGEDGGSTPVTLDAWCRQHLGWASPQVPSVKGATLSMGLPLSSAQALAKLRCPGITGQEYFLVENRYPSGWDRGLVGYFGSTWGGLLALHVDDALYSNAYVSGSHQMVMAEHADGAVYGSYGTKNSLFSAAGNPAFTPATTPSSLLYTGASSLVGFTTASVLGTAMTFNFYVEDSGLALGVDPATAVLLPGASLSLTASGDRGWGVDWTLAGSGGATKVDAGLSTTLTVPSSAPLLDLAFTVKASSAADTTVSASSTVRVKSMDLDASGAVDALDLLPLALGWGLGSSAPANLKGSGVVGDTDLAALLTQL